MMFLLARILQFAGLVVLPVGILLELQGQFNLRESLLMAVFGAALFGVGYTIQASLSR
ncbi:hypothetical protein Pan216_47670 [Planctomycetes bacterium Pan216]|uniref:Uncharacterized protein n=1 Tax=Kolteria novifilia TaxID=2527975 RepID=A0A518BA78_9BACT|nr:hypothetical protein Pan216_47670 [Planctomycetes bacterium Pan216]